MILFILCNIMNADHTVYGFDAEHHDGNGIGSFPELHREA